VPDALYVMKSEELKRSEVNVEMLSTWSNFERQAEWTSTNPATRPYLIKNTYNSHSYVMDKLKEGKSYI